MDLTIENVESAINDIRPALQADGGDVKLLELTAEGVVLLELQGACNGCAMATMTLKGGIERWLKSKIPAVSSVEAVNI